MFKKNKFQALKMGLIFLYLILKSVEKLKFRNKALKKKSHDHFFIIVDVVSNASEGYSDLKSFKVFEWRILFTNSGWGLEEALPLSAGQ